jgi:hypothetical protein
MDKSGYDFRIQRAEIDKEDIKYFKQWNHCRPVLFKNNRRNVNRMFSSDSRIYDNLMRTLFTSKYLPLFEF